MVDGAAVVLSTPNRAVRPGHETICCGDRRDVELLQGIQEGALRDEEMNPFYFAPPLAPLVAARDAGRDISLEEVLARIRDVKKRCEYLLIEGAGGLMAPLGHGYTAADLIARLGCRTLLVSRNRLGVLNHVLLGAFWLQYLGLKEVRVVLMGCRRRDISAQSNAGILQELLASVAVSEIPYLGPGPLRSGGLKKKCEEIKKSLAQLADFVTLAPFFGQER